MMLQNLMIWMPIKKMMKTNEWRLVTLGAWVTAFVVLFYAIQIQGNKCQSRSFYSFLRTLSKENSKNRWQESPLKQEIRWCCCYCNCQLYCYIFLSGLMGVGLPIIVLRLSLN